MTTTTALRATVAASLVLGTALTIVSLLLMPDFTGDQADTLTSIAAAPAASTVSAVGFTLSQLFVAVGVVGVAHLLRPSAPVLAATAATLVLLGTFGHAVYGGISLATLSMAQDPGAVETHVALLGRVEQGAVLPFMAAGLGGTVLGFVVLGVALWRGGPGPRWVGPALVLWVVVEFVGTGFVEWATYASGLLFAAVFLTLAVEVWRSAPAHWLSAAEATLPGAPGSGQTTSPTCAADPQRTKKSPLTARSAT